MPPHEFMTSIYFSDKWQLKESPVVSLNGTTLQSFARAIFISADKAAKPVKVNVLKARRSTRLWSFIC